MHQHGRYAARFILHVGVPLLAISAAVADGPTPSLRINHDDIRKVEIIGKLGRPLGQLVNIRGHWATAEDQSKPSEPVFLVTHFDGKPLAEPVEFDLVVPVGPASPGFKKPKLNEKLPETTWELRGHEMGKGVFGRSGEAMEEAGIQPAAMLPDFSIEFRYVNARKYVSPAIRRSTPSKPK